MHHRGHGPSGEDPVQHRLVPHAAPDEPGLFHQLPVPGGQVIQNQHRKAGLQKGPDHVGPDIAGPAGHQDKWLIHKCLLGKNPANGSG